jgi:signal peptidase II
VARERAWRLAAVAAALFVALDQATKQLVIASIARGESRNVFFGIDLTNTRNNGVAFGALAGGGAIITVLTLAALTLLVVYFALRASTPWLWLPTGVILGGALGNLADRARDGAVIDFIDPSFWPAFNVADMGVVIGILGLLYVIEGRELDETAGGEPASAGER